MTNRVYVKAPLFEGWATVLDVFPAELFPIHEPDGDGHRTKRVSKDEITKEADQ